LLTPKGSQLSEMSIKAALSGRRTRREFSSTPIPLDSLNQLIWAGQGVTASNGLRTAPSAHALHPIQLLACIAHVDGSPSGLYAVNKQSSELSALHQRDIRSMLEANALGEQPWISSASVILTLCADFITPTQDFASQPPYGQRGSRYVYIEAGAMAQNIQLQAVELGIACVLVAGFQDEATATVLGLEQGITPVLHLCLGMVKP